MVTDVLYWNIPSLHQQFCRNFTAYFTLLKQGELGLGAKTVRVSIKGLQLHFRTTDIMQTVEKKQGNVENIAEIS